MAEIQFEGESQQQGYQPVEQKSLFIRIVLATGIVTTDRQAEYILLGFAASMVLLAFVVPSLIGGKHSQVPQNVIDAAIQPPPYYP